MREKILWALAGAAALLGVELILAAGFYWGRATAPGENPPAAPRRAAPAGDTETTTGKQMEQARQLLDFKNPPADFLAPVIPAAEGEK